MTAPYSLHNTCFKSARTLLKMTEKGVTSDCEQREMQPNVRRGGAESPYKKNLRSRTRCQGARDFDGPERIDPAASR